MKTIRVRTLGWLVALVAGLVLAGPAFAAAGCCDKGDGGGCFATDKAEPRVTELRPAAEPASRDEPEPAAGR